MSKLCRSLPILHEIAAQFQVGSLDGIAILAQQATQPLVNQSFGLP
jgi:hypothetical protein